MRKVLLPSLLIALSACPAAAAPGAAKLDVAALLRRTSILLRGTPPDMSVFNEYWKLDAGRRAQLLKKQREEYLSSPAFAFTMAQRAEIMLGLSPETSLKGDEGPLEEVLDPSNKLRATNPFGTFLFKLAQEDRSWDEILTGTPAPRLLSDPRYLTVDTGPAASGPGSGVLSLPRFLERYPNTPLNQNRKRAAAVFRAFLCDPMIPVPVNDFAGKQLGKSKDPHFVAQMHAETPACMGCHQRLDPLARFFDGAELGGLQRTQVVSQLRTRNGHVEDGLVGLAGLAAGLTRAPEYAECQVSHFWNWFIGEEVPRTRERTRELVREFDRVGRSPRRFVAYLTEQPEFSTPPDPVLVAQASLHRRVKPILAACDDCHRSGRSAELFDRAWIGGSPSTHRQWVDRIAQATDLFGDGSRARMPDPEGRWDKARVSGARDALRAWVCAGAPNQGGRPTLKDVPAECARTSPKSALPAKPAAQAQFQATWKRYLTGLDLMKIFRGPDSGDGALFGSCLVLDADRRMQLGVPLPTSGRPFSPTLNGSYLEYILDCTSAEPNSFSFFSNLLSPQVASRWKARWGYLTWDGADLGGLVDFRYQAIRDLTDRFFAHLPPRRRERKAEDILKAIYSLSNSRNSFTAVNGLAAAVGLMLVDPEYLTY